MARVLGLVLAQVLMLTWPATVAAHRLDEYLQATRVDVGRDRIGIEIDLTPGVSIAADVFARIDRDLDRVVSGEEAEAYARQVLADIALELDARTLAPVLTRVEVPSADEIREGIGTIRIEASATIEAADAGHHWIGLRNNHQPERSVYLVNALLPRAGEISIARQTRDASQRDARIEYEVASTRTARTSWVLFGVLCLSALMVGRQVRLTQGA